jgi:hypothetical protein
VPYVILKLQIFQVLAAVPDKHQQERITGLMQSADGVGGLGLLVAGKELAVSRSAQHFSGDFYSSPVGRCVKAIEELYKQKETNTWMSEHRSLWTWLDQLSHREGTGTVLRQSDF